MDHPIQQLAGLAELFTDLSDAERLDKAAVFAQRLRQMASRAGETNASPAVYERLIGAAEALEAITKGRTAGGDTDRTSDTEGES